MARKPRRDAGRGDLGHFDAAAVLRAADGQKVVTRACDPVTAVKVTPATLPVSGVDVNLTRKEGS